MLMIGNPTPDLEIEAFMPDGRFEHLRFTACEWQPGDRLLVAA